MAGLEACKTYLHGRLMLAKGNTPQKVVDLRSNLMALWSRIGPWNLIFLGKGFYEFSFSSLEDMQSVLAVGLWNLQPGSLRLFSWTKDFNLYMLKHTNTQVWVRIYGLPQEYWQPNILYAIAGGIRVPICLDEAASRRTYGHFARVLIDVDLNSNLRDKIMMEKEDFSFSTWIEYEKLPEFCATCQYIGHSYGNCFKMKGTPEKKGMQEQPRQIYVPKPTAKPLENQDSGTSKDQETDVPSPGHLNMSKGKEPAHNSSRPNAASSSHTAEELP